MVLSSFKTSLRSLTRYRFYTLLNIVGFSLGLTLVIYIGLYLYEQFSYDKWYPEHDRIYRVEFGDWALLGPVYSRVISSSSADIEQVLRVNNNFGTNAPVTLEDQPNTFRIPSLLLADSSFFDFFPFQFLAGTAQTALKDKFSIVVTRSEAVRLFGSVDAVGKIVRLHDRHPLTVTGVIEDVQLFHLKFDAVTSFSLFENIYSPQYMESTGNWNHNTYIKTHPEANPELIAQNIEKTAIDYINELFGTVPDWNINLRPIADIYFTDAKMHESMVVHGNKTVSYVLLIIAVFILGIAVINYMNLSTARSAGRSRETGIRKLLGSTRNGLMMRYYAETLLITFVAVILALLLVEVFMPFFHYATQSQLTLSDVGLGKFVAFLIVATLIVGFLSGIYPALYLSRFQPVTVLKGEMVKGKNAAFFRKILIVFQFTISIALIASTIIIYLQINFMSKHETVFPREGIIHFRLNSKIDRSWESFQSTLASHPDIGGIGLSNSIPGYVRWQESVQVNGEIFQFTFWPVTPEYFDMLGVELLAGRSFSREMASEENYAVLVNEQWLYKSGLDFETYEDVLEQKIGDRYKITGVIPDFHFNSLHEVIGPLMLIWRENAVVTASVEILSDDYSPALDHIISSWNAISPGDVIDYRYLDDSIGKLYKEEYRLGSILISFSGFAIFIACLGLIGLSSFMVERRAREISIRMVLGATLVNLMKLLTKEFLILIAIALVLAIPSSWWGMQQWLGTFAYRIDLTFWPFLISGGIAIILTVIIMGYHVVKLSHSNPSEALRKE